MLTLCLFEDFKKGERIRYYQLTHKILDLEIFYWDLDLITDRQFYIFPHFLSIMFQMSRQI
jgi:hypothetical protein